MNYAMTQLSCPAQHNSYRGLSKGLKKKKKKTTKNSPEPLLLHQTSIIKWPLTGTETKVQVAVLQRILLQTVSCSDFLWSLLAISKRWQHNKPPVTYLDAKLTVASHLTLRDMSDISLNAKLHHAMSNNNTIGQCLLTLVDNCNHLTIMWRWWAMRCNAKLTTN